MADSDKIGISDKKDVRVEFEDVDLLSAEERAALKLDIDEEASTDDKDTAKADTKEEQAAETAQTDEEETGKESVQSQDQKVADEPQADSTDSDEQPFAMDAGDSIPIPPAPASTKNILSEGALDQLTLDIEANNKAFNDGEMEFQEYLDKRDDLRDIKNLHDAAVDNVGAGVQDQWEWEQDYYLSSPENNWILADSIKYAAFATAVNNIMATDEGETIPGPDLLAMARKEVEKVFVMPGSAEAANQATRAAEAEAKNKATHLKTARDREAGRMPPETLGGKPAAEVDQGVSEFDYIDKLDGEAYEEAIEKMSDVQLARYEASI